MNDSNFSKKLKGSGFIVGWRNISRYLGIPENTLVRNWRNWGIPIFFLETSEKFRRPVIHVADIEAWRKAKLRAAYMEERNSKMRIINPPKPQSE